MTVEARKQQLQTHFTEKQIRQFFRPVKKQTSIQDLIQEQNYQGPNKAAIDEIARKLNITEPLDELLSQLTR